MIGLIKSAGGFLFGPKVPLSKATTIRAARKISLPTPGACNTKTTTTVYAKLQDGLWFICTNILEDTPNRDPYISEIVSEGIAGNEIIDKLRIAADRLRPKNRLEELKSIYTLFKPESDSEDGSIICLETAESRTKGLIRKESLVAPAPVEPKKDAQSANSTPEAPSAG